MAHFAVVIKGPTFQANPPAYYNNEWLRAFPTLGRAQTHACLAARGLRKRVVIVEGEPGGYVEVETYGTDGVREL